MTRAFSYWPVSVAFLACAAVAQTQPFPTSFERAELLDWIADQTEVRPQDVVSVGATDIIAVQSITPVGDDAPETYQIRIHAEVVSARVAEMEGYRSWTGLMRVDCSRQAIRVLQIRNFSERNLAGASREAPSSDEWLQPGLGSQLFSVVRAACDKAFTRPFGDVAVAQTGTSGEAVAIAPAQTAAPTPPDLPPPVAAVEPKAAAEAAAGAASRAVVQISAAMSRTLAEQDIERVTTRFAAGRKLTPQVQKVVQSGKVFYRARLSGFDSVQDAKAFCQSLKAGSQDCFVGSGRS